MTRHQDPFDPDLADLRSGVMESSVDDERHDRSTFKRCGANRRQEPGRCRKPAGWGTDHPGWGLCKLHGGSMKAHRTAAAQERANARLSVVLAAWGASEELEGVADPLAILADLTNQSVRVAKAMSKIVAELSELRYETDSEQLRSEVQVLERAMDRAGRLAERMVSLGILERQVQLSEKQSEQLIGLLTSVLGQLGHPISEPDVRTLVVREMRALEVAS